MSVSKKNVKSVKRPHVKWYEVYLDIDNESVKLAFYKFIQEHKKMSYDRAAYNVLKKYYSTTSLARVRWLGGSLNEL